ncbi:hypothetical protein [Bartonella henselae]|nr:hypothetical protein [Bartonella henselae]PNM39174.1 integrase [Bartonella henselae str. Houston-1]ATP13065.1 hypothetical protein BhenCHDE101_08590 [Bartonella henselae]ETS04254.1 hypothetical protein Q654_01654 [Bartonella henselae JK 50]ETS05082.1 hypothetical protein Q655_01601 [Bartonella henselae JK 51]UAK84047.1 DUF4102 domain-containing protein [Bartonella henselae]
MPLMNRLKCQGLVQYFELVKWYDAAGLKRHNCKEDGARWIYCYILHRCRREMGLDTLRDVSLK